MDVTYRSFTKKKLSNKWESQELQVLKEFIQQMNPKTTQQWRLLCLRMHEKGSRRTISQYRNKGMTILMKRQVLKEVKSKVNEEIYKCFFEDGDSFPTIYSKFKGVYPVSAKVRSVLVGRFVYMKSIIKKIVGISKTRTITMNDSKLMCYAHGKDPQLFSPVKFTQFSEKWRAAKNYKLKKSLYQGDQKIIQLGNLMENNRKQLQVSSNYLKQFNDSLIRYQKEFKRENYKALIKQRIKPQIISDKSMSVPARHLSEVLKKLISRQATNQMDSSKIFIQNYHQQQEPSIRQEEEWRFEQFHIQNDISFHFECFQSDFFKPKYQYQDIFDYLDY